MKPILFNTDMVQAILAGHKTVTRRLIKPRYRDGEAGFQIITNAHTGKYIRVEIIDEWEAETRRLHEPYLPGDILYIRETWQYGGPLDGNDQVVEPLQYYYAADGDPFDCWLNDDGSYHEGMKWRPSIHMPKEAARIFLRVTDVRAERLQEITDEGAKAEGANSGVGVADKIRMSAIQRFQRIWDSTIKPADLPRYGWAADPWVWVIEFERCEKPEGDA